MIDTNLLYVPVTDGLISVIRERDSSLSFKQKEIKIYLKNNKKTIEMKLLE